MDSLPGGFFVYRADEEGEILYANRYVFEMFECESFDDFMKTYGGRFSNMIHPSDLENTEREIERQIRSGSDNFDHVSYRAWTKNHRLLYIEDFGRKGTLVDGTPVYYVFIVDMDTKNLTFDIDRLTGFPG